MESIFGTPDAERRRWQRRNHTIVTELLKLGENRKLPPLAWTVPAIGAPTGEVRYQVDAAHPREQFEAWFVALSKHSKTRPYGLGIGGQGDARRERTTETGKTSLAAGFELQLPRWSSVTIFASWYEDEFATATDPKAGA